MKRIFSSILTPVAFFLLWACSDPAEKTSEIAPVSNVSYEAGNGTILFHWDKPTDPNLAYTEISYTNDDGVERKVLVDATLTEKLVRGFGSSKSYEFKFITHNTEGSTSEPVSFYASPLEPLMNIFNGKVKIVVDFGGVHLSWDNIYDEDFYIDLEYSDINGNDYKEEILAPANQAKSQFIAVASKLEGTQTIYINAYISDTYGNQSVPQILKFRKLEAGKFTRKGVWKVVDLSSVQGNHAYDDDSSEGAALNMLDDKASTFYHSNWDDAKYPFPHHVTFDLGGKKRIEKAEFQQRQNTHMANGVELYGSNTFDTDETTSWTYCGGFFLEQSNGIQVFELPNAVEYRYIKLMFTTPGSKAGLAALAEFALYGQDISE